MDPKKRSTLIAFGALGTVYAAFQVVPKLIPERVSFVELDSPTGFRRYDAGETSSGAFNLFIGLDNDQTEDIIAARQSAYERVNANVCDALYRGLELRPGQVPIASFSDYYCPFCRVQTRRLADMTKARSDEVAVAWHELPLLGEYSNTAALAALAAKRQGAYVEFHDHLMKAPFVADQAYLQRLSDNIGVDFNVLVQDMNSVSVRQELEDSAALSRVFSFVGTPALVIGRSVIQGQISDRAIDEIIELESDGAWSQLCNA